MCGKSLQVLILSPFFSPNIGGVESHLDDLCAYLQKRGHKVFVITYQPLTTKVKSPKFERARNLEIRRIGWVGHNLFHKLEPYPALEFIYLTPMLLFYSFPFLFRRKNDVDVIHAHGVNAAFVATVLGKVFGKKIVVSVHAIYNLSGKPMLARLIKISLSSFPKVLTLANRSKMELAKIGLDNDRIEVFTHWVDQEAFRPIDHVECKKKLRLENTFAVLFVGRLLEIKGVKLLLEVAKKLVDLRDMLFVFVGEGPLANDVEVASDKFGNVLYAGKVEKEILNLYYNAADVVVVPSIYEEGFGRVVIEALSCGTPVIASNRGGVPEALSQSVGKLLQPSLEEIQKAIHCLYDHPTKLVELRRNCRKYAENRFSENNAKLIENAYSG